MPYIKEKTMQIRQNFAEKSQELGSFLAQVGQSMTEEASQGKEKIISNFKQYLVTSAKFFEQASVTHPVAPSYAVLMLVFSIFTIFSCCICTTLCVRVARDCNVVVNGANLRRQYHRNT